MESMAVSVEVFREAFASLLYPYGDKYRQSELFLSQIETQPEFIVRLLQLVIDPNEDSGVRRLGAIYLKNKVVKSWSSKGGGAISDADKQVFKSYLILAIAHCDTSLREFLIICLAKIMEFDYQNGSWPELIAEVNTLIRSTELGTIAAGLLILKQICRFYRWNTVKVNKQLGPLMAEIYPVVLNIAEAAVTALEASNDKEIAEIVLYYELIYETLKIYKQSTTRFLPEVFRTEDIAKRTIALFLKTFVLPLPAAVLAVQSPSERAAQLPVKCQKWATANILRTHNNYLTKSYTLSENAASYAPYRQLFLSLFTPEITKLYVIKLQAWSEHAQWYSDNVLYNIVSYLTAILEFKKIFADIVEPRFGGLLGQVMFPLLCPNDDDLDLFEDDPVEFIQKQVDIHDVLSPSHVAADFVYSAVRKRKHHLPIVLEFLKQFASKLGEQPENVKERVGFQKLLQALGPILLGSSKSQGSYRALLESLLAESVIPDLKSQNAFLRYEACYTIGKLSNLAYESRDTVQLLFQYTLNCFFDESSLPVQVAAALTLELLSEKPHNEDVRAVVKLHITEIIRNLLSITQRIDLESLLAVLDHFVAQFPDQITPFAVELAAQLCQQFISVASELAEAQRKLNESGGGAVSESEVMLLTNEKTTAGYSIMNSLANLQNNLEHQRELTGHLDQVIAPVFLAVYQNELIDFYQDCLSLHENTLFTIKSVPSHHWQYFELLLVILQKSRFDYFEDAMPVLENYVLYGSQHLAANSDLLAKFVHLLISLYAPASESNNEVGEVSVLFSDARTRAHVMSLASKLMVSSDLFNGPLLSYLPLVVDGVISRVSLDSSNPKATFPPRYNVATVSVVLSGIYHDPEVTLMTLHSRGAVESFLQTWFETLNEFTRVNDLKLSVMAALSLLSYQSSHPDWQNNMLPQLLHAMIHSLGALPGAVSRVAELMKQDEVDWDDDDLDLENLDDDYDETNEENDASTEFVDQMPDPSASSAGDGNFIYERPGPVGAAEQSSGTEGDHTVEDAVRSQVVTQMGFVADDFDEDVYSVSPLDSLNPYDALRTVFAGVESSNVNLYNRVMDALSESDRGILSDSIQRESLAQ